MYHNEQLSSEEAVYGPNRVSYVWVPALDAYAGNFLTGRNLTLKLFI